MRDLEHARLMLTVARKDLKAMGGMTDVEAFDVEIFGFHAQQAVEKALKAWLSLSGIEYPWTHDLEQLFVLLEQGGETISDHFRSLVDLTDFAVQFRYEAFEGPDSEVDRMEVINRVTELIKHVDDLITKVGS
jgi:HEPN domain-containing protein